MALLFYVLALSIAFTTAVPSYFYPVEHRSISEVEPVQQISYIPFPKYYDETAVLEYYNPTHLSIWNYIPSFKTAVSLVVSKVWAVTKWVVVKASFVLLGIGLVLGFCSLTPFCNITFRKNSYLHHAYRSLTEYSTLDKIEDFVYKSIEKFRGYQDEKSD